MSTAALTQGLLPSSSRRQMFRCGFCDSVRQHDDDITAVRMTRERLGDSEKSGACAMTPPGRPQKDEDAQILRLPPPRGQGREELIASTMRWIGRVGVNGVTMREVAAGAGLSLGSASYHFANRPELVKTALDFQVRLTELAVAHALDGCQPARAEHGGGVHAGLVAIFADRDQVLVRHELHLDAARSTTHRKLHQRSQAAIDRLVTAAHAQTGRDTSDESVHATVVRLEAIALDTAVRQRVEHTFHRAMIARIRSALAPIDR